MSRKLRKSFVRHPGAILFFCYFRAKEFFNTHRRLHSQSPRRLPTVADPLLRSMSCTSFLIRAARLVQSFGLDGANRAQSVGESSELFRVSLLRL